MRSRPTPAWRFSTCLRGSAPASTSSPAANWRACWPPAATPARSCSPASAKRQTRCAPRSRPASSASTSNRSANCIDLNRVAGEAGKVAPVSFRVNPDVDPKTHPYISTGLKENKFGVPIADAPALYRLAASLPNLKITGIDCHIGSQLTDLSPLVDAADRVLALVDTLAAEGITLHHIDLGGGVGIRYHDETPPDLDAYGHTLAARFAGRQRETAAGTGALAGRQCRPAAHPRRVPEARRRQKLRHRRCRHERSDASRTVRGVSRHRRRQPERNSRTSATTSSARSAKPAIFLALRAIWRSRKATCSPLLSAGAYGMSMASNYNSRPRAAEILIDKNEIHLIRERETQDGLMAGERLVY